MTNLGGKDSKYGQVISFRAICSLFWAAAGSCNLIGQYCIHGNVGLRECLLPHFVLTGWYIEAA